VPNVEQSETQFMSIETWLLYAFAILILTASPGPSVLLCASKSVSSGLSSARWAALGGVTAITIILSLSFTGLGVVIASSDFAFTLIKWVGAAYLIYLGVTALLSKETTYELSSQPDKKEGRVGHYFSGFLVGSSNPKAIVFFTALFPQFIDPTTSLFVQYLIFTSTFIAFELGWLLIYAHLAHRSTGWLLKKGRVQIFNRITGITFICAGALLSTSKRALN
jgi:threonine/homoserine/homoserine lactone efflux protein